MKILTDFRGLREISRVGRPRRPQRIAAVFDENGVEKSSAEDIAEVFAKFYESLYASRRPVATNSLQRRQGDAPPFSSEELITALKQMKSGKTKDTSGIVAEMIKYGGGSLHDAILEVFNDLLCPEALPPASWKRSRLTVLFKKNDPKCVKNYRPIAIIPILYKLFSRMLCNRIQSDVFTRLSPDQAAYRQGYSTDDHLVTVILLIERCKEFNQDLFF